MPVTASNRKALRNSQAKRAHNSAAKAELKRTLKNATVENADKVVSVVDKAAKRNIIHANKAARIKSALAKLFANGGVKPAAAKKAAKTKKVSKKTVAKKAAK